VVELAWRVVMLRHPLRGKMLLASKDDRQGQLAFIESNVPTVRYEYALLVTLDYK
jgi:hypothetical protein